MPDLNDKHDKPSGFVWNVLIFMVFWLRGFVKQFAPVALLSSYWGLMLSFIAQIVCNDGNEL
jgi:hypothetical protein